jgi:hypothetical protein
LFARSVTYHPTPSCQPSGETGEPRSPPAGGGVRGEMSPPGVLATRLARGAVGQLRHRCPRVKRDETAGLVGCWIRRPPKAAPPSRRVRPPASIALDRNHGRPPAAGCRSRSVAGGGTRLRRVLLRWQAPQPCRSGPRGTVAEAVDPYASGYASPYASPYAGHPRTPSLLGGRIPAGQTPSWGQSAAKTAADWPPYGGVERTGRAVRFAQLMHRPVRILGGPAVRAAFGGNLKPALVATQCVAVMARRVNRCWRWLTWRRYAWGRPGSRHTFTQHRPPPPGRGGALRAID